MDEEGSQLFGNVNRDLENSFGNVKSSDMESIPDDDNGAIKEEYIKLHESSPQILSKLIDSKYLVSKADFDRTHVDNITTNDSTEKRELENFCDPGLNSEENNDAVILLSPLPLSKITDTSENVNTNHLILTTEIQQQHEMETREDSHCTRQMSDITKTETLLDEVEENRSIQCNDKTLFESNSEISNNMEALEVAPDEMNADKNKDSDLSDNINSRDGVATLKACLTKFSDDDDEKSVSYFNNELSDDNEEQIQFNCNDSSFRAKPPEQPSLSSLLELNTSMTTIKNRIQDNANRHNFQPEVTNIPAGFAQANSDPLDSVTRSNSVTESNAIRSNKPSLADDAKLVKFTVSTKSMNIIQSNAQFLNKSRNFLNFITEKSTNIMERTLLPQNLTAKYNSMLKLTENNRANYQNCAIVSGTSSQSVENNLIRYSGSDLVNDNRTREPIRSHVVDNLLDSSIISRSNKEDQSGLKMGCVEDNSVDENRELFLKCLTNENDLNRALLSIRKESDARSFENLPVNAELINSLPCQNIKAISADNVQEDQDIISTTETHDSFSSDEVSETILVEDSKSICRKRLTSDILMNRNESIKQNATTHGSRFSGETNDIISPSMTQLSDEHTDQKQNFDEKAVTTSLEDQSIGLLDHPAYVTLLRDYSNLREQSAKLSETLVKVEKENQRLVAENNGELYALQLETLEGTIEQLKNDLKQSATIHDMLNKNYIIANKERESMVMKYAISEKQLIETQRAREYAERKVNEAFREQELLHTKLKQVQGERTRICNILDGKSHELTDAQKEVDRLKEELNMRDVKLKWTQNKLKTELEAQKENQQKLDKAMQRINEMKEECEHVRKESQETIRKFQQSEENKVVTLDQQLKEQQARLILERHVTEDKETSRLQLQKEVETLKQRQHVLIDENNTLSSKVQDLEQEKLNYENTLSNLEVTADQRQKEIVDLAGKVSELETLKLQLLHKEQLLSSNEAEVDRLRQSNAELQTDMDWCREREAHMLDFTQKLTDKNVRLQSEFTAIEAKNEQLELEQGPLHDQIRHLTSKVKELEISLASEKRKRTEECELLARHVAEQTQLARNLAQKLEDSQGENAVLRRKQQVSVKEMAKELQQCKKRLDAFETSTPSKSLDLTSRAGSSSSLSTGETLNGTISDNSNSGDHVLQTVEPDRQALIDRIVKLQKTRVKQAEKLDFLEEHTKTLVNELQKKSKIIKNYILHENPDAMGSNERDRNKHIKGRRNAAELARHGGIMASVYNQRVSDDNMTLELSLEINRKLQAVLEDTLLKNITLKDSIDTLGGEIARLTMQNNRRQ
ncbi:intracellular protein transport protein USO1 isoform X1 [Athalia rosae]|uniref:intracellular protein transport protein USO1 isoform X1 n=1 Tax=Athalia rosae TaxID=37344 RepID=UPI002034126C|nr:intracellular protein transport protein USO1 isoform X1 [Athalia rosae]